MRWLSLTICVLLSLAATRPGRAQGSDPTLAASARALFEEGVAKADAGEWVDAADRFRRALALRESQVIRYNLGAALAELGKLVEASELLRQVERDGAAEPRMRDAARTRLTDLTPRIAKLTIRTGASSDARIQLDDRELVPAQLDVAMPVDPGAHVIVARRAETTLERRTVTLAEGEAAVLTLSLAVSSPIVPSVAAATPEPGPRLTAEPAQPSALLPPADASPQTDSDKRKKRLWWGVGGGVVGAAAVAVVLVLVTGKSSSSSAQSYQGDFDPPSVPVRVGR